MSTFGARLGAALRFSCRLEVVDRGQIVHCLVQDGMQIGVLRDPALGIDILRHLDVNTVRERTVEHDLDIKAVAALPAAQSAPARASPFSGFR